MTSLINPPKLSNIVMKERIEAIKYIYGLFNSGQLPGIKFGLVPLGIKAKMEKLKVTVEDIINYDKVVGSKIIL